MSDEKSMPQFVFSYSALSAMQIQDEVQVLYLISDNNRSDVSARIKLNSPMAFREALSSILFEIRRGFDYRPSDGSEEDQQATEALEQFKAELPSLSPIMARQKLHKFMEKWDPAAWLVPDAVATIQPDGLSIEIFDKKGKVYHRVFVSSEAYEVIGDISYGSANIETGMDLYKTLQLITGDKPLEIKLGCDVESHGKVYRGEVTKKQPIPKWWVRTYLQLMGYSTLSGRRLSMSRMDLYNFLRHLRLNKENDEAVKRNGRATLFALAPGKPPEIIIQPWNTSIVCSSDVYRGEKAEIIGVWDRRQLWAFERLLPMVQDVKAQLLGKAQPGFWTLDCGGVEYTLGMVGFSAGNWAKGITMDLMLPRHTANHEKHSVVLDSFTGCVSIDELVQSTGLNSEVVTKILRRGCQNGQVFFDLFANKYWKRQLFANSIEEEEYRFRDEQEREAYDLAGDSIETIAENLGIKSTHFSLAYTKVGRSLVAYNNISGSAYFSISQFVVGSHKAIASAVEQVGIPLFQVKSFYRRVFKRGMDLRQMLDNKIDEDVALHLYGKSGLTEKDFRKVSHLERKESNEVQSRIIQDISEMAKESGISREHAGQLLSLPNVKMGDKSYPMSRLVMADDAASEAIDSLSAISKVSDIGAVLARFCLPLPQIASEVGITESQAGLVVALCTNGRVQKNMFIRPTGEIDFTECTVSEPKNEFQEKDPVYEPAFEWSTQKGVRKESCTCAFWKKQTSGTKEKCEHLKALWLKHSRDVVAENIACQQDTSLIEKDSCRYIKRDKAGEKEETIELNRRRLSIGWNQQQRKQTFIFSSTASARKDYLKRKQQLESKGFLNASGS